MAFWYRSALESNVPSEEKWIVETCKQIMKLVDPYNDALRDSDDAQGTLVYTAPAGVTGIILMAQIANVSDTTTGASFIHRDVGTGTETNLVKDFQVVPQKKQCRHNCIR